MRSFPTRRSSDLVLLRRAVCGFNLIDIDHRAGRYPLPLPTPLGGEAVGVVAGVGEAVSTLRVGDRVIYKMSLGAYAEHRLIDADEAVSLPDAVGSIDAAALFTKALTAEFLLRRLHRSEEHTSELQSLMRISYAVFCLNKNKH